MVRLGTAYIDVRSQVRIEPLGPGSCGPQLYYPTVPQTIGVIQKGHVSSISFTRLVAIDDSSW